MILSTISLIAGILMFGRSALFWLYFIQMKQYRLDRLRAALRTAQFRRLFISPHRLILVALLILNFVAGIFAWNVKFALAATALYVVFYAGRTMYAYGRRELQLPAWTRKIAALFLLILACELLVLYFRQRISTLLLLEMVQPLIVLGIFALVYTPNLLLHRYFIGHARKKIAAHENLIVIGITGSYGKTSTKEYLAHILGKKFKVLKTPAHINVDTGVAKVILRDLRPEHEVFIVEMGAYKKGEIKKICELVRPQYAVLTGLSDQHLELFGSLEAIADAKFELVEAVAGSARGVIVANADSEALVSEYKRRRVMPVWYGIRGHGTRFKPSHVVPTEQGTTFILHGVPFQVPTIGTAALNNLLGAFTTAVALGMHLDDLARAARDLPRLQSTMEPKSGTNGSLLIDDTYNANTEGVLAALADLEHFNRAKRIFVFSEIIELGERTAEDHARIAQAAARYATHVFLLPSQMMHAMRSQLIERGYTAAQIIRSTEELQKLLDAEAVVLLEGRDAAKILAKL